MPYRLRYIDKVEGPSKLPIVMVKLSLATMELKYSTTASMSYTKKMQHLDKDDNVSNRYKILMQQQMRWALIQTYQQALANQRVNLSSPTNASRNFLATQIEVEEFHQINHWTFMAALVEEVAMSWSLSSNISGTRDCKA
jgi:hypothetical protein